jgi:hypothetical protein
MQKEETIFPGLLPSPEDIRDFPLSAVAPIPAAIPDNMPRTFNIPIHNQGSNPSCVGHSGAVLRSYLAYKQGIEIEFDGEWLYQQCKLIDGMPDVKGTYFRSALQVMQKVGAMPINGGDPAKWKIGAYAKVDDLKRLNEANFLYGMLLSGFTGSNPGWQQSHIRAPLAGEATWGHAIGRCGYGRDKYGIIQNSWGEGKGNCGIFYHPQDYNPFESWFVMTDNLLSAPAGVYGYAAKDYIQDGKVTSSIGLNLRITPGGKVIKVLPVGTKVKEYAEQMEIVNGILWEYVEVI